MNSTSEPCIIRNSPTVNQLALLIFLSLGAYGLFLVSAYATPTNSPMGSVMCAVVGMIYGNLGKGIAVLGIAAIGVGATLGKVSWTLAVTVGTGIGVLFGSDTIAYYLITGGTGYAC